MTLDNIGKVVSSGGVKLHLFVPSNRKIWTVVGKEKEYWLDPELGFCSCEDYYYNEMTKNGICYHLKATKAAQEKGVVEKIQFTDSEFDDFARALIDDILEQ